MNLLLHEDRAQCERFLDFLGGPAVIARVLGPRQFSLIALNPPGRAFFGLKPIDREVRLEVDDLAPYFIGGLGSAEVYLERLRDNYQHVVNTGELRLTETEYVDGDGQVRWSQNKLAPVLDADGVVARILVTFSDVTDLIEAKNTLENSLAGIMNASDVSVCTDCGKVSENGNWETLSAFLQDRTELEYSHCLCSACEKKYFGDLDESSGS